MPPVIDEEKDKKPGISPELISMAVSGAANRIGEKEKSKEEKTSKEPSSVVSSSDAGTASSGNNSDTASKVSTFDPNDPKITYNDIALPNVFERVLGKNRLDYGIKLEKDVPGLYNATDGKVDEGGKKEGTNATDGKVDEGGKKEGTNATDGKTSKPSWFDTLMGQYQDTSEKYADLLEEDKKAAEKERKRQNIANVFTALASLGNSIGVAAGGKDAGPVNISSNVMKSISDDERLRKGYLREALANNQRALSNINRAVEFNAEMERKKALDEYRVTLDNKKLEQRLAEIDAENKYYEGLLDERIRHNKAMESQNAANEEGRNSRNEANNQTRKEVKQMGETGASQRNAADNRTRKEVASMRSSRNGSGNNAEEKKKKETIKRLAKHAENYENSRTLINEYDAEMRKINRNYESPYSQKGSYYILTEQDLYEMFNSAPAFAKKYLADTTEAREPLIDIDAEFNVRGGSKKIDEKYND